MAGEFILLGGVLAFAFAILVLTRPNIAIPGVVLGTPMAYIAYIDGIWAVVQTVFIMVIFFAAVIVLDEYAKARERNNS